MQLYVNNEKIDIPLKLSLENGRLLFIKVFIFIINRNTKKETFSLIHLICQMMIFHRDQNQEIKK